MGPSEVGIDILALAATFEPAPLKAAHVDAEDASSMVYTGGTTGKPKGVVGSFRSGAALNQIQMSEWQWPEDNRFLICTPLSHAGAAFFIPTLLRGGALIVLPAFEPGAVLEAIEKHKITATMLVPTMIYMLMDHPDLPKRDVSSLQTLFYGASAMSPARLQEGIKKFGQIFFQFYGQAEAPMTVCVMRRSEHDANNPNRLASCGRPVPYVDVALLADDAELQTLVPPVDLAVQHVGFELAAVLPVAAVVEVAANQGEAQVREGVKQHIGIQKHFTGHKFPPVSVGPSVPYCWPAWLQANA